MPLHESFRPINVGVALVFGKGLVEKFAKAFVSIPWFEFKELFLWYHRAYVLVVIVKCLNKLLTIVVVAVGPYVDDKAQKFPVRTNSDLRGRS